MSHFTVRYYMGTSIAMNVPRRCWVFIEKCVVWIRVVLLAVIDWSLWFSWVSNFREMSRGRDWDFNHFSLKSELADSSTRHTFDPHSISTPNLKPKDFVAEKGIFMIFTKRPLWGRKMSETKNSGDIWCTFVSLVYPKNFVKIGRILSEF